MLHTDTFPATDPDLPPLLIVHRLLGSARNWGAIARNLSDRRQVLAVDMRNHGSSLHDPDHSYAAMAGDLAQVIGAGRMDVLGHSMGGKAAMILALTQPDRIDRLIVADIAPVAYGHDQTQHVRAMLALDLTDLTTRAEADRRLALTTPDPALRAFFLQSLDLKAEGGPRWRLNLPVLAEQMAGIVGWPGTPGQFPRPALFLSGADSRYVLPEHRPAITARFPHARFARIPGAGHWLHAEKPRAFTETVAVFLSAGRGTAFA